jgi:hypothetical protein
MTPNTSLSQAGSTAAPTDAAVEIQGWPNRVS